MKLKATYETEVYISEGGYLCIKQKDFTGNEDAVVMFSPEQATLVANEMFRLAHDAGWWELGSSDEEPESQTPENFVTQMNLRSAERAAEAREIIMDMNLAKSKDI